MQLSFVAVLVLLISSHVAALEYNGPPEILLAKVYNNNIHLENYWVSEKLDGVRAFWNGKQFISRRGNIFHAPKWFTKVLPQLSLDGELWLGRGRFEELSGIVRRQNPTDSDWKNIYYMVFDLPHSPSVFNVRLKQLDKIITEINSKHIQLIKHYKVATHLNLQKQLNTLVAQGAEGLMLHAGASLYKSGRHNDLLKLKKYDDAEAIVLKHLPGKGKYKGLMGSILVENRDNKRFKIGTGFTDAERKHPPAIGSTISYKYTGLTNHGIPRFASYMRIRKEY